VKKELVGTCPICNNSLDVTELSCSKCDTVISGEFNTCAFCSLSEDDKFFVETFIRCRGNIKEVEKALGISYPTVRSRLKQISEELGYTGQKKYDFNKEEQKRIIEELEAEEISVKEALNLLKELKE